MRHCSSESEGRLGEVGVLSRDLFTSEKRGVEWNFTCYTYTCSGGLPESETLHPNAKSPSDCTHNSGISPWSAVDPYMLIFQPSLALTLVLFSYCWSGKMFWAFFLYSGNNLMYHIAYPFALFHRFSIQFALNFHNLICSLINFFFSMINSFFNKPFFFLFSC